MTAPALIVIHAAGNCVHVPVVLVLEGGCLSVQMTPENAARIVALVERSRIQRARRVGV